MMMWVCMMIRMNSWDVSIFAAGSDRGSSEGLEMRYGGECLRGSG